jgi:hypothetical protein
VHRVLRRKAGYGGWGTCSEPRRAGTTAAAAAAPADRAHGALQLGLVARDGDHDRSFLVQRSDDSQANTSTPTRHHTHAPQQPPRCPSCRGCLRMRSSSSCSIFRRLVGCPAAYRQGRATVTRRMVAQPPQWPAKGQSHDDGDLRHGGETKGPRRQRPPREAQGRPVGPLGRHRGCSDWIACPLGRPACRLPVREASGVRRCSHWIAAAGRRPAGRGGKGQPASRQPAAAAQQPSSSPASSQAAEGASQQDGFACFVQYGRRRSQLARIASTSAARRSVGGGGGGRACSVVARVVTARRTVRSHPRYGICSRRSSSLPCGEHSRAEPGSGTLAASTVKQLAAPARGPTPPTPHGAVTRSGTGYG